MTFIPVTVEIMIGSSISAILPASKISGMKPKIDFIQGEVVKIGVAKSGFDRMFRVRCKLKSDGSIKHFNVSEYRVMEFTFGGIPLINYKFDKTRIEKEDGVKLHSIMIFP